ncbi:copper resistance protein D [Neokomagataea thailandica NBRC 106555]|nr:copper resistance protein D [Neokomagataea thailandica NBRC 106555]
MTLVWFGHAASNDFGLGWLHLVADVVHILAASVWGGSLAALYWFLLKRKDASVIESILKKFSFTGYIIVTLLTATGLINSYFLIGTNLKNYIHPSAYVLLIYLKVIFFALMLVLAACNHFVLTPYLQRGLAGDKEAHALRRLKVSIGLEYACYVVIIGIVALVGGQGFSPDM